MGENEKKRNMKDRKKRKKRGRKEKEKERKRGGKKVKLLLVSSVQIARDSMGQEVS